MSAMKRELGSGRPFADRAAGASLLVEGTTPAAGFETSRGVAAACAGEASSGGTCRCLVGADGVMASAPFRP